MNSKIVFNNFFNAIRMDSPDAYSEGLAGIAKKLNEHYYNSSSSTEHLMLVGSVGRRTAVDKTSDVDALFILPEEVFNRFDSYASNGQSALLQEVKNVLLERYPKTEMSGDGQAVVIDFTNKGYAIDLVPAFARANGAFDYPDTHNDGSWKKTDPAPEQNRCSKVNLESDGNFKRLCNTIRVWRETAGVIFGGLLIDTLVDNYLEHNQLMHASVEHFYALLTDLFGYLMNENPNQEYWLALGSNQRVFNEGNGAFVRKAKKAHQQLMEASTDIEKEEALINLLGKRFENALNSASQSSTQSAWALKYGVTVHEQYIEELFPVRITSSLQIDCTVTQNGFRPTSLLEIVRDKKFLRKDKKLRFYIKATSVKEPYLVYWKVRNCGELAYSRDCVRGDIVIDEGKHEKREHTDFNGPHFVECYIAKNNVCIARDKIDVPIRVS